MKSYGANGLGIILILLLAELSHSQQAGRGGKQEPRSIITNELIKNQEIMV